MFRKVFLSGLLPVVNLALRKIYIHLPQYTQERMKRNNHVKKSLENNFYTNTGSNITRDEFAITNNRHFDYIRNSSN